MAHRENKVLHMSSRGDVRQQGLSAANVNQKANLVIYKQFR